MVITMELVHVTKGRVAVTREGWCSHKGRVGHKGKEGWWCGHKCEGGVVTREGGMVTRGKGGHKRRGWCGHKGGGGVVTRGG